MGKIVASAILLAFLLVSMFSFVQIARTASSVVVTSNPVWTDTGLNVGIGENIGVTASGNWTWSTSSGWFGPEGKLPWDSSDAGDNFLYEANHGELIAFVGPDPYQGHFGDSGFFPQHTGYWIIGSSAAFVSDKVGELWLGMNDDAVTRGVGDNAGEVTASVSFKAWFVKLSYPDYAQSGMPDFDQKQSNWTNPTVGWTWCGPVAAANSLWWLDSEYESIRNPIPVPPPVNSDSFPLVTAYGPWDDHDPRNLEPLVNSLAFLMDTDGIRTHLNHSGTFFDDMETGISQYLQKQGVNPKGDCDADGDVDGDDARILIAAFGSLPGNLRWNMAADLNVDNKINIADQILLADNYGKVGMFYEHTKEFPDFPWIIQEVVASQDVELLLEFWQDIGGGNWNRYMYDPGGQGGHYLTVAGFNSTTSEILLSDPWQDAFEAGTAPGESPVPHPYPHLPSVHNNTIFVSHDGYLASPWMIPQPSPYPGKAVWELVGYLQTMGFDPSWHAFIRTAIVTSPHGIAIGLVSTLKDLCTPMPTFGQGITYNVTVRVLNEGTTPQSCDVTVYINSTAMQTKTLTNLPPNSTTLLNFSWNTGNWTFGDYILSAKANVSYNTFSEYYVSRLVLSGDLDGNGWVEIYDAQYLANAFNTTPEKPLGTSPGQWNPNADINGDNEVNIYDAILLAGHFNWHYL